MGGAATPQGQAALVIIFLSQFVTGQRFRVVVSVTHCYRIIGRAVTWAKGLINGSYRSLTGGSYVSKSDRPYADRPSQHLQLAPSYLTGRASMMCVIHRFVGAH
jgi:hypothetical protein